MSKKEKYRVIEGVKHIGKIPKSHGNLQWLIDRFPLWVTVVMAFVSIAIEMFAFACLYSVVSSTPFMESLNYSLFSVLGENVPVSVNNSLWVNRIISIQVILTNCTISFFMAIILYKLMSIKPKLIKMEEHLVFDPTSGTLRLRVANTSKFILTNVHVDAYFRIHVPNGRRHANARLLLKTETMNAFRPYTAWNIASKPFLPEDKKGAQLDFKRYDSDRIYEFIPDLLTEKYRSDDAEEAERTDYINLNVVIIIKSPLFGVDWVYQQSFKTSDFVCGRLISLDPNKKGEQITDWSNWGRYEDMSEIHCEKCVFADNCGIIKKSERYSTIN